MTSQTPTRSHRNTGARIAMKEAWRLARRGRTVFGGSVRAYLAEALRLAWADLKADPVFQEVQKMIAKINARKALLDGQHPAGSRFATRTYAPAWASMGR